MSDNLQIRPRHPNGPPLSLERMVRPCVTHHYACDCRENLMRGLLKEVVSWHSDPNCPEYNECDKNPCWWCEQAKMLLGPNDPSSATRPKSYEYN